MKVRKGEYNREASSSLYKSIFCQHNLSMKLNTTFSE